MNVLRFIEDPNVRDTIQHIARVALETNGTNLRLDFGTVTLSCTANTLAGATVSFKRMFKKGTTPVLFLFGNPATTSSKITVSHDKTKLPNTACQPQVYSDTTQNVDVVYLALG